MFFLTTYVPYNPAVWKEFWNSIMTTIGSTTAVGFIVFGALFCIVLFKAVIRMFL